MSTGSPPRLSALRAILADDTAPLSAVFFAGVAAGGYDLEVAAMDSEAFIAEVEANTDRQLSEFNRIKLIAGQMVYFTDMVYQDLPAFIDFANLVDAQAPPPIDVFNPASVLECSLAVLEIAIIDQSGLENDSGDKLANVFNPEILTYWGGILATKGVLWPIPPLENAIMPQFDTMDSPEIFAAIDTGSQDFKRAINHALWTQGKEIFSYLKKIPTLQGEPLMKAQAMQTIITNLVGDQL